MFLLKSQNRQGGNVVTAMKTSNLARLTEVFRTYTDIRAVYLFGSTASGKIHTESDLDLGIVPRNERLRARRLEILTDLAQCGFCDVDLVFLDTDDVVLKYEVVRQNRVIYQVEDFDRGEMYSRTVGQYLDFLPYLEVQREAYKRRILDGQARGRTETTE